MPGQWEFQIGPVGPLEVGDQLWIARWLLYRIAEDFDVVRHARPEAGQGRLERRRLRTPTSPPRRCARATTPIIAACEALGDARPRSTSPSYGAGIEDRLTGLHETAPWTEFSYGVSDRGASVRIPWQVEVDKKGYIEDRRPNANMDPYVGHPADRQTRLLGAAEPEPQRVAPRATARPGVAPLAIGRPTASPIQLASGPDILEETVQSAPPTKSWHWPRTRASSSSTSASVTCPGLMQHFIDPRRTS